MRSIHWILLLALLPFILQCGGGPRRQTAHDSHKIRADIRAGHFDVPIIANERTADWIEFFQTRGRKHFARHLERSSRYLPLMRKILKEHDLPQDLVYVALIESGFSAHAYSRAAAVGFWQFIRGTGLRYKLRISRDVDERRDFEKSTHAAARYLKDLYARFGDWHLAMAGYNAGEGKIERAIRRHGSRDYWKLIQYSYLRKETKNYIPKFQAAALIANNPEKYGFKQLDYKKPYEYEKVTIKKRPIDLRIAAKLSKTKYQELEKLNPELNRWYTPPRRSSYTLRVPKGSADNFKKKYASLPSYKHMADKTYRVKEGDSLDTIAKRHDLPLDFLAMANGLSEKSSLKTGKNIGIPSKPPAGMRKYLGHYEGRDGKRIRHKVRSGDSLWKIARRYRVKLRDLKKWNRGRVGKYLKPGQTLYVYSNAPSKKSKSFSKKTVASKTSTTKTDSYRVKSGDTLSTIAAAHHVRTRDLREWNKGHLGKYLKPGQKLVLHAKTSAKASTKASAPVAKKSSGSAGSGPDWVNYKVRDGDSLWTIAQRHRVSVSKLKEWNGSSVGRYLKPGQRIAIYRSGSPTITKKEPVVTKLEVKPAVATPSKGTKIFHTIQSGDTLWDIARKYRVRTKDLKEWNGIDQVRHLKPGDKLKILVKRDVAQEV